MLNLASFMGKKIWQSKPDIAIRMADLGWRIAIVLMTPILIGDWLDKDSSHTFGIIGFVVAIVLTAVVTVRYVNQHYPETFGENIND